MPSHHEISLQRDIDRIRAKVLEMARLNERALNQCVTALRERNRQLAYSVILGDRYIDELEKQIDRLCLEFLVRQQPVAGPLRFAYGTIRINLELERIGDYAESIARQSLKLMSMEDTVPLARIEEIAGLSIPMLHDAIEAFVTEDAELARKTVHTEEAVDVLKSNLNRDLVALFRESKLPFESLNPLMMISRRLERVSDQARNICMEVLYMCTGEYSRHQGTEAHRLLFFGKHNACRSQMAEAIGNALGHPDFIFMSAGLAPEPIQPDTMEFLRSKGMDPSRFHPKSLDRVPNLEHYHVIIGLAPEVLKAFPMGPKKVVLLDWSVADPSKVTGPPAERTAAYENTYAFLETHVRDLVGALRETKSS